MTSQLPGVALNKPQCSISSRYDKVTTVLQLGRFIEKDAPSEARQSGGLAVAAAEPPLIPVSTQSKSG